MKTYFLMNKDEKLLEFAIEASLSGEDYCFETDSFTSLRPIGFSDINTWVEHRNYAKHKSHLSKWLKEWGLDTKHGFIDATHCLGLNDTLWVKMNGSELTWADVSLYTNEFSDIVEKTAFETGLHGLKLSTTSPEFTSEGSFAKCWIKKEDNIYLVKRGSEGFMNAGMEPYSEFYATPIAKILCADTVEYSLVRYKGTIASECQLFTDENVGFVPFYKFVEDKNKSLSYEDIISMCGQFGFEEQFREMMVLDSLIFNEDRHTGNFGFLVDNDTFAVKKFAPVFDHNMSLLSRELISDLEHFCKDMDVLYKEKGHKLGGDFDIVAKNLMTSDIHHKVSEVAHHVISAEGKINFEPERLKLLNDIYQRNVERIRK